MVIEKEINGEVVKKEIFEQDFAYFASRGWKKSEKKEPVTNKKGRKRSFNIGEEE